jgi:hypothetical protein
MMNKPDRWAQFYAAALAGEIARDVLQDMDNVAQRAANLADSAMLQFERRWPV